LGWWSNRNRLHLTEPTDSTGLYFSDSSGNDYRGALSGGTFTSPTDVWKPGILNFDTSPRVAPIWINDNDDFVDFSSSGNGTVEAPYILENFYLSSDNTALVQIYNTTAHFEFKNSILNGMETIKAIILTNVSYGQIMYNSISDCLGAGIKLQNAHYNNLYSNEILDTLGEGSKIISADSSHNNTFLYNTLNSGWHGIYLVDCFNNTFFGNIIGITGNAIYLIGSDFNNMSWNKFVENFNGVSLSSSSGSSDNNVVQWNYFINNSNTPQAYDAGVNNIFRYNYWNDHTSPDTTPADGIVDTPYSIDGGSNQDLYPRSVVGPILTVVSPLAQTYNVPKINISLMGNAYQYSYYIDGIDTQNQTWTSNITRIVTDGVYIIHIYGIDPVGYITHETVSFTIDFFKIISPVAQEYGSPPINISFSGYASHYWYYIEGIDSDNQTWTDNIYRPLPAGSYTLHAYGNDTEGIIIHHSVDITVETTPPIIQFINPLNATYFQDSIDLSYTVTDYETYIFYFDGQDIPAWSGMTLGFPGIEDEGRHNFTIVAIDELGNIARSTVIFYIYIPPTLNIESPQPTIYETEAISISLTGDALHYWYYIDNIDSTNQTWTIDVTRNLPAGIYTLHAYGNTSSGAIAHKNVSFTIDIFISTTTTLPATTTEQASTTTSKGSYFPGIITVLLSLLPLATIFRKRQKRN
jgi:parallel beta-helix repeat protein